MAEVDLSITSRVALDNGWRVGAKCSQPKVKAWLDNLLCEAEEEEEVTANVLNATQAATPDVWFPRKGPKSTTYARCAKEVCLGEDGGDPCPVLFACREYAIARNERFGIWGGMSEQERNRVRRNRRRVLRDRGRVLVRK